MKDMNEKLRLYEKHGVREYWIVDPSEQTIEVYILDQGSYKLLGKWGVGETAYSKLLVDFQVDVDDLVLR